MRVVVCGCSLGTTVVVALVTKTVVSMMGTEVVTEGVLFTPPLERLGAMPKTATSPWELEDAELELDAVAVEMVGPAVLGRIFGGFRRFTMASRRARRRSVRLGPSSFFSAFKGYYN